jgi:UDP-glucose 4-epimerase
MRSVLVSGADSPTGERLVRTLLGDSRVDRVLAVVRGKVERSPLMASDRLRIVGVDLASARRAHELLFGPARDMAIDVVVHLGHLTPPGEEGERAHAQSVESVRSIIELSERHPTIRRLVLRSDAAVYQVQRDLPVLIGEDHPLNMAGTAPQYVRDRVEADVTACVRMGLSPLQIVVLRMAEILGPGTGSQLFDYLGSPVCLRPAGYDPMLNLLTQDDAVAALQRAIHSEAQGVFNIPGADTLPLTACIASWGRLSIPVPGVWMTPLYRWRRLVTGHDFRYGMNRRRFHYSGVLDGTRARQVLGYVSAHPVDWPSPVWDREPR